jgi:hypothetical protein
VGVSVKRYEINQPGVGSGELAEMDECESGGFVSYCDYDALKEENERIKHKSQELTFFVDQYGELFKASTAVRDALKARVAELEEILADYKEER